MYNYYEKNKVFSLQKSSDEEVHFSVAEKRGKVFLDIRIYHVHEDGSKTSTHKGIFFPVEKLHEFKEGVECLVEAVEKKPAA